MQEGVRAYVRSPAAALSTLLGGVAVGVVVVAGIRVALAVGDLEALDNPMFLGGFGPLLYGVVLALGVAAVAVVWLPFGAAVAYAVGRGVRDGRASVGETATATLDASEPLYRWVRTRAAVGPLAERVLTEDDVASTEVAAGCARYVVPAAVLDAPALPGAVERANRVTPRPGRERVPLACAAVFGALAIGSYVVDPGGLGVVLALGVGVVGCVLAAALDTAWRAGVYATQDLSEGFVR